MGGDLPERFPKERQSVSGTLRRFPVPGQGLPYRSSERYCVGGSERPKAFETLGGPNMIRNPVLPGFNPDPSILRVGTDYYIATSTFEWYPGVRIHHSTDLVHWRPLGGVLTER